MSTPHDLPSKPSRWLLKLEYGSSALRFAGPGATDDVTYNAEVYGTADFGVKLPASTGNLEEQFAIINTMNWRLPADLVAGLPFPTVYATLYEQLLVFADDPLNTVEVDSTYIHLKRVRCRKLHVSGLDRAGEVRMEFETAKERTKITMGVPANKTCDHALFDTLCALEEVRETALLFSIDPLAVDDDRMIWIQGLPHPMAAPGGTPGKFWHLGYIEFNDVRVGIRDWNAAQPNVFHLKRRVPDSWVGQNIDVVAGCDKSIETCRARWDNELRFRGLGYKIPNRHPVHEQA